MQLVVAGGGDSLLTTGHWPLTGELHEHNFSMRDLP
jgi:hypothetical protein